jgi:cell division protein FtsI/penicillin-binding protein 2
MAKSASFNPNIRIWVLTIVSFLLILILVGRLADLQIVRHGYFMAVAENQRKRASELMPHRGTIYMTESASDDGSDVYPVATNKRSYIIYAVPRNMTDPQSVAEQLAPALQAFRQRQQDRTKAIIEDTGQNILLQLHPTPTPSEVPTPSPSIQPSDQVAIVQQDLSNKFTKKDSPYAPLIKPYEFIDDEFKQFLDDKKLPGIVVEEEETRVYPEKTLAAHILGYVGYQDTGLVGRYGIEGEWQKQLAGSLGFMSGERDARGGFIGVADKEFNPASNGDDVVLTVDRVVQSFIEDELKKGVEKYGAERGSVLVMDPHTGAVLGMATYPTFDPNYYYAINDPRVQLNPVVSDLFEPGSILKPLVMAAAIEEKKVTPETTMVDNGPVKVAKYTINTFDGKHHGVQTMTQVLEQSNNVGMVWVGQQLGAETMYDYFRRFGLGERTGIELEGETQSTLPEPAKWNIATVATSAFGQGIALTPLQALDGINTLANKGVLMQPNIVREVRHSDGTTKKTDPQAVRQVVSPDTAEKLSAMMVSVIENGVGRAARVPGYYMAGKTGTAQVPDDRGKYSPDRKIISFVGFGPVENPKFSILIKLDNPAGLSFASGTSAPMFKAITEKLLQYYQVPPSYDATVKQPTYTVNPAG